MNTPLKKAIKNLLFFLTPTVMILLYDFCTRAFMLYADDPHSAKIRILSLIIEALGNGIIALYLFFNCKAVFKKTQRPEVFIGHPLGVLLVPAVFALNFIPAFDLGVVNHFLLGTMPQFTFMAVFLLGIFFYQIYEKKVFDKEYEFHV